MFSFILMRSVLPQDEEFRISQDNEGEYHEIFQERGIQFEIDEDERGTLLVSFESHWGWVQYFWSFLLAVSLGQSFYFILKRDEEEKKAEAEEGDYYVPQVSHCPHPDPVYEEFLREDENRRLFPKPELEEDFEAWKAKRDFTS